MTSDDLYSLETTLNVTLATTFDDVIGNATSPTVADVFRTIAFLLFLITGVTLNCIQISVILQTSQLRTDRFSVLVVSLAAVNLVDCLGNIPSTALESHSRNGLWDHDNALYTIDCIIVYLVCMVTLLGLLFMVADRLAELRGSLGLTRHCTDTLTPSVCVRMMAVYSWVHGTILAIPLSLPAFSSTGCQGHSCQGRLAYLWTMALVGFVVPVIVLCCLYGYVIYTAVQQSAGCKAYASESAPAVPRSACRPDLGDFKYLAWLTTAWFVLQAPLLVARFVVLTGADDTKKPRGGGKDEVPGPPPRISFGLCIALRWLFVAYTLLLPVLTFCWRRDTCHRLKVILTCRKTNIVVDSSPCHHAAAPQPPSAASPQRNQFAVPVLFATPNGLHVQLQHAQATTTKTIVGPGDDSPMTGRPQWASCSPSVNKKNHEVPSQTTPPTIVVSKRCDVFGSFNSRDVLSDDGNTSECDSSYDCNFFVLQSNRPVTDASRKNDDHHHRLSANDQTKTVALVDSSDRSRAIDCCRSSLNVQNRTSPLRASFVAPDVDRLTVQKIEMCYLDTAGSGDNGQRSMETVIEGDGNRLSNQGKEDDKTETVWHTRETSLSSELPQSPATVDPSGHHKQSSGKQGRKKRKQRAPKNSTEQRNSEGKAAVMTVESKDSTIITNDNTQKAERLKRGERTENSEPASVEETNVTSTDFKAETNNNELKAVKVKRKRQTSESSNNLLDSSNTSSEFSMLQSAYHHA